MSESFFSEVVLILPARTSYLAGCRLDDLKWPLVAGIFKGYREFTRVFGIFPTGEKESMICHPSKRRDFTQTTGLESLLLPKGFLSVHRFLGAWLDYIGQTQKLIESNFSWNPLPYLSITLT